MLYLKPPFHIIEGVSVFPDHEQEHVFHYAPAMPHLTTKPDPVTGQAIPQLQLLKYRGDAGSGGLLNFSVDLSIPEDVDENGKSKLDRVTSELRSEFGLNRAPILAPISFEDGDVKLVILGQESDNDDDADEDDVDDDPRFVLNVTHHSKPALYGVNNAIFSVELDGDGVQLMEAALRDEVSGIGIIYSLHFNALRPAYRVSVDVDWDRVQTHLEENFSASVMCLSTDVSEVIDELIEDRVINIEVDTFLSEGEDSGAWAGNRDEAIREFKDMITETFFTPAPPPQRAADDNWEKGIKTAERVGLLLATGGWSGVASLSYRKIETTQIDRKSMNLTMNERITMRKSIYPQAVLEGLFDVLRDANGDVDISRFVTEVTLDDPWFKRREITAHTLADFDGGQVAALNVSMEYEGQTTSVRLTKSDPEETRSWPSTIIDGAMARDVAYSYSVEFAGVDVSERPGRITSTQTTGTGDSIEIAPQNDRLFFIDQIKVGTSSFPWNRFPLIELQMRYRDEASGIDLNDSFLVTQTTPEITWPRFRMDPDLDSFEIRQTFHGADHRNRTLEWQTVDQEMLILRDPMPQNRTVTIVPTVDWSQVSLVLAEVSYTDTENGIFKSVPMVFNGPTPEGQSSKSFTVNLLDATKRFVRYSARIIFKDGHQVAIPTSETQQTFVTITPDMLGHRVIEVRGPDADFVASDLTRIELELSFKDDDFGLSASDKLIFDGPGQVKFFEFDYARAETRALTAIRTDIFGNGMRNRHDMGLTVENPMRLALL